MLVDFRAALEEPGQLHLEYQAAGIHCAPRSGRWQEARLRWTHLPGQCVASGIHSGLWEQTQLGQTLTALGHLQAAIEQAAVWQNSRRSTCACRFNISASELEEDRPGRAVAAYDDQHALPVTSIELEFDRECICRNIDIRAQSKRQPIWQVSQLGCTPDGRHPRSQ